LNTLSSRVVVLAALVEILQTEALEAVVRVDSVQEQGLVSPQAPITPLPLAAAVQAALAAAIPYLAPLHLLVAAKAETITAVMVITAVLVAAAQVDSQALLELAELEIPQALVLPKAQTAEMALLIPILPEAVVVALLLLDQQQAGLQPVMAAQAQPQAFLAAL
jgi:hypothetical protein